MPDLIANRIPPSARRRRLIGKQRQVAHLRHIAAHIHADAEWRKRQRPRWDREIIRLTIGGPRKNADPDTYLKLWGAPLSLGDLAALEGMPLLPIGGWGVFQTPPMAALGAAAVKGAAHPAGIAYLVTLAMATLFSEATLSETAAFAADCMHMCPIAETAPSASANEWTTVGLTIVNTWQARRSAGGKGVGDEARLVEILADFRDTAAMRQVRQAEIDLANARVGIYRGAALRRAPQAAVLGALASADSQQALTIAGEVASPHHAKETPCLT